MTSGNRPVDDKDTTSGSGYLFDAAKKLDAYGSLLTMLLGIIGNTLALAVLSRKRLRKTVTSRYLIVLAVSDLGATMVGQVGRHITRNFTSIDPANTANWYCKVWYYGLYVLSSYSGWVLTGVSVERCVAVLLPLKAHIIFSKRSSYIYLTVLFVCSLAYNSHMFFSYRLVDEGTRYNCGINAASYFVLHVRPWSDFLFKALIPGVIIITSNVLIIIRLIHRQFCGITNQSVQQIELMSMVPMLVTVSVAYICLTSPMHITYVLLSYYSASFTNPWIVMLWSVDVICFYLNHSINFFLYVVSGREFRGELIAMICRPKSSAQLTGSTSTLATTYGKSESSINTHI